MRLEAGMKVELDVAREVSPNGYFLTNGIQDVLLHYSEVDGDIEVGDQVNVFLYHDTEDRLTATMRTPYIEYGEVSLLEVQDHHPNLGLFLDMGLGRQLLLPMSELPEVEFLLPRLGDKVYIVSERDKQGRLLARLAKDSDLLPLVFAAPDSWKNTTLTGIVYKTLKIGSFVIAGSGILGFGAIGFIHQSERTKPLRIGEKVEARVTHIRKDGRVNLSMRPVKEIGREEHAEAILAFLQGRQQGEMPYTDRTSPEIIQEKFGISKAAFKRALGKLMKEGRIIQEEGWTRLKE